MRVTDEPHRRHFKLRSILLTVNVILLLLPLGGVLFFRIYENELVKQTELELISQATLISAIYKEEIGQLLKSDRKSRYGVAAQMHMTTDNSYRPVSPQLNLFAHKIQPRPKEGMKTGIVPDPLGLAAGEKLGPILLDAQRTNLSGVRILDYQGIVVAGPAEIGLSFAHLDEVQQALSGRYASAIRERVLNQPAPAFASISRGTGIRVFAAFPIVNENRVLGVVLLSRTPRSILQHMYSEKETIILIAVALLLLAIGLAIFTSYTIARPVRALIEQTRQFARGDKQALEPLKSPVTEEVARLSQSFSEMAQSLEQRSEYIRNFAAHVSHEFKTPLTGIQGAIELLQEHLEDMPAEKRARFLRNMAQDTERLKRLMDRLLEMARADVVEPSSGTTAVAPLVERLRERYKDFGLTVSFSGNQETYALMPSEILESVFSNLLDNSRQNGADRVEISVSMANRVLSLTITDNGKGVSQANAEKIFTPFFTTHREDGGTGLGLGIVKSLLKAYGAGIALDPSDTGATFTISIPATRF